MTIKVHAFCGGAVTLWAEPDGPVMLRAVEQSGDPVELTETEAAKLADALRALVDQISN